MSKPPLPAALQPVLRLSPVSELPAEAEAPLPARSETAWRDSAHPSLTTRRSKVDIYTVACSKCRCQSRGDPKVPAPTLAGAGFQLAQAVKKADGQSGRRAGPCGNVSGLENVTSSHL